MLAVLAVLNSVQLFSLCLLDVLNSSNILLQGCDILLEGLYISPLLLLGILESSNILLEGGNVLLNRPDIPSLLVQFLILPIKPLRQGLILLADNLSKLIK